MKRHHILLILLLVGITAYFVNETRNLRSTESNVSAELDMLRAAVKKSPGALSTRTGKSSNSRPPAIDPAGFAADLSDILKGRPGEETRKSLMEFQEKYEAQLNSASLSKLKEICSLLEKDFPFDQKDSEMARQAWLFIVGLAAKSDPGWAFAKFDETASAANAPIAAALDTFKRWGSMNEEGMSLSYAAALKKWLDAAQAGGRIEEGSPLVAELRAGIAAAQGNSSDAVKQISQLPYTSQRKVAVDYIEGLSTPEARRQALEELSTALDHQNFPHAVGALADQQGFAAAREILGSASLIPERHDLAAASIAAANIGPDTPAKAKWLLESLRSDDMRAVVEFTDRWSHADYQGAAQWMNSLPAGKQRDAAVTGFAPVAVKIDGATAVDWALTLTDPAQRNSCLDEVVRKWSETDAEAAGAYLKEKGLPVK
jgi:hypothetical protein